MTKMNNLLRRKNYKGFTLLEILVVITIFAILGILVTQSILLTLRGSQKSETTLKVRENISYAVSVMDRQIRNADSVSPCPNSDTTTLHYVDQYGKSSTFSCVGVGTNDSYIASGSARLTNSDIAVTNCSISCNSGTSTSPSYVSITLSVQDSSITGVTNTSISSTTTIQLRNY